MIAQIGLDALTGLIAGSVVAVTLAAFKLIERIHGQPIQKVEVEVPSDLKAAIFNAERHGATLIRQHAPEQGVERWKWPSELTEIIRAVGETQRAQVRLMESQSLNLEKHREKEENTLVEIRDALRDGNTALGALLKELKG